jgi:hypothetical protein
MKSYYGSNLTQRRLFSSFLRFATLTLLFAAIACIPAVADPVVQITQCNAVISQPGHYILANDLNCASSGDPSQPPFGIKILASHVDLALDGHTISGDSSSGSFGIGVGEPFTNVSTNTDHVHIIGPGIVSHWSVGVYLSVDESSSVSEVTADSNAVGLLDNGESDVLDGNTATNNNGSVDVGPFVAVGGITIAQARKASVRNSTVSGNAAGITLIIAAINDVRFNTVTNNSGVGIGLDNVSLHNSIFYNTETGNGSLDLEDDTPNCDSNTWKNNTFGTANQPCID